jgi:ribosomal-protein-alanine N-acetyltransferase
MAFFRTIGFSNQPPAIQGRGVLLRTPRMGDFEQWSQLRGRSRAFLAPWEPVWPDDDLSRSAFRRRLRRYDRDLREESGYAFLAFRHSDGAMIGGITLTNFRRGAAQSASIGYWMGEPYAGRGYMTAAVAALVPFAHSALRIRRLEAACLPTNAASIKLLERLHFVREGLAREYLSIAGRWQDHLLYAHLAADPLPEAPAPR